LGTKTKPVKPHSNNQVGKEFSYMINIFYLLCIFLASHYAAAKPVPSTPVGTVIPFALIDNRIFLDVRINGAGPFKMILDSNSSSLTVSSEVARQLHLPLLNPTPCGGAGVGQQTCFDTHLDSATIGGIATQSDDASVTPISAIAQAIGFRQLDGVLGVHFFEEHVLKFDYQKHRLFIYPSVADFSAQGLVVTLSPDHDYPEFLGAQATVDGRPGFFALDTGDRSNLTIFQPFADASHIRDAYPKFVTAVTGQGINGPIHADVLRLNRFELSGAVFEDFPARFPPPQDFSSTKMSGSIGNGLLKAFNFFFDYPHRRLILLKQTRENYRNYDRSGLWLTHRTNGFMIDDIVAGSPAAALGLRPGNLIIRVDGVSVSKFSLPSFREHLSDPDVRSVHITVIGSRGLQNYTLRLADLI
jgi:hypothetical protein